MTWTETDKGASSFIRKGIYTGRVSRSSFPSPTTRADIANIIFGNTTAEVTRYDMETLYGVNRVENTFLEMSKNTSNWSEIK